MIGHGCRHDDVTGWIILTRHMNQVLQHRESGTLSHVNSLPEAAAKRAYDRLLLSIHLRPQLPGRLLLAGRDPREQILHVVLASQGYEFAPVIQDGV